MAGFEIDIAANARDFQRGTKDVEAALEDVADALDDVARDAQLAGEEMGDGLGDGAQDGAKQTAKSTGDMSRSLKEVGDDAERAGRELGDEIGDGAKDAERATERATDDISKSLKDVEKDAERAGRELGDEIGDGAKDAGTSVERVEKSFKELADASKRSTTKVGNDLKTDVKRGTDGASEAVGEFKDEAISNLSETVSSFRGEAEDIAQIAQDTLGGVVANLGPVGMAAGVAGAVGIGLIIAEIEKAKEAEQEFRENVAELADTLIETGGDGADAIAAIADRMRGLATETDKNAMDFDKLRGMAEDMKVPFADLAQAYASGDGDLQKYIKNLDKRIDAEILAAQESTKYVEGATLGTTALGLELEKQRDQLKGVADQYKEAGEDAAAWEESGGAAIAARAEAMDTLQGELDEAIGTWGDYIDAETGAVDPAGYLEGMQARMDATANFNTNVQDMATEFGLTQEEVQTILDQGVEFAPMLQSILDSGMGETYAEQVRSMLGGGQAILDGTPLNSTITAESNTEDAEAGLEKTRATERTATVKGTADTRDADRSLEATRAKRRTATITGRADTSAAERSLEATRSKTRTAIIAAKADTTAARASLDGLTKALTISVGVNLYQAERDLNAFVTRARTAIVDVQTRNGKAVP
ncbi:hypothetical protein JOF28_001967 [Leucobacter exalbidus]|uniref:Uncharacterized protein n=1 Tax=Leucobacter exalbidus TaxID=662960 RepID=A0A940PV08_9MICO|nr:hypothetical protein [Leucobacter exalbidus]MBP1326735.1 hypothetical protein [Leucobacter exalbidus]